MESSQFQQFTKIPRLHRDIIITEKLDGTNAQVYITDEDVIMAGSRTRWLEPGKQDNFGFASWVKANEQELLKLGPGRHFGEWWGKGIQRGYGLTERRFSLFNTTRWNDSIERPECCYVVPTLYVGPFNDAAIEFTLETLRTKGSQAIPFMNPEGIVIFHTVSGYLFKKTLEHDDKPKGAMAELVTQ